MLIAGLYYMLIACPYYMMMQLMLMAGLCLHLPPVLIPRCATSHPSWSPTCPATRTGAGPTVAEHQDQPAGPGQTWENSALRKSSQAETLHRGKKPSAREGGEQGVETGLLRVEVTLSRWIQLLYSQGSLTPDQPQTWTNGGSQYQDLDRSCVTLN